MADRLIQGARSATGSFQAITEKMSSNKFIKASKELNGAFKSMLSAIPGIGILSTLLTQFLDATGILKPFQAVFDVILGLFGIMGAQIIPVLMEALMPLIDLLLEMTPVFIFLGQVIAVLIQIHLIRFTLAIQVLTEIMIPLLPIFEELIPILQDLRPIISEVSQEINTLAPIIAILVAPLAVLVGLFVEARGAINGLAIAIQSVINIANSFNPFSDGGGGGGSGGGDDEWWDPFNLF